MPRTSIRSFRYRRPENPTWDLDLEASMHIDPTTLNTPHDWSVLFNREAPFEVEIGFGRARFLLTAAQRWPEHNWLGIEFVPQGAALCGERAASLDLHNLLLLHGAAEDYLDNFAPRSVDVFHLYFPDPWPKRRHRKRRFLQPAIAVRLLSILKPGGRFHIASDHLDLFQWMVPIIIDAGFISAEVPNFYSDEAFVTNFEKKAERKGVPINRASFTTPDGH